MDQAGLLAIWDKLLAPWVRDVGMRLVQVDAREAVLHVPYSDRLKHAGGVVCGQALMAIADTAMLAAVCGALGEFRPMTTVSLNTSFMRGVKQGDMRAVARVLRQGRNLVFGEVQIFDAAGELAAHATTTYALLKSA